MTGEDKDDEETGRAGSVGPNSDPTYGEGSSRRSGRKREDGGGGGGGGGDKQKGIAMKTWLLKKLDETMAPVDMKCVRSLTRPTHEADDSSQRPTVRRQLHDAPRPRRLARLLSSHPSARLVRSCPLPPQQALVSWRPALCRRRQHDLLERHVLQRGRLADLEGRAVPPGACRCDDLDHFVPTNAFAL